MLDFITPLIPVFSIALLVLIILLTGYVKASPDTAYIISGLRKKPKVLIGRAGVKIPFFEKKDELNLQLIPIDVKTSSAVPTADYINIKVDAAVNVKISDNEERLSLAAQNFLNKKSDYIAQVAREVLEGNMREIVGKMNLEEMVSDRQKFATLVKENAEPDLAAMGLDIVSFNVQNFVDGNGVIENLGVDNIVKIQKNAAISRAEAEKEIAKAQSNALKESNDARVVAETRISQTNNELEIRKAELKQESDAKKAAADAAYEIQSQEQRKTIEIATVNASIAKAERETELRKHEVAVAQQALEAEINKKADAERYAVEQRAAAELNKRQRDAEAKRYEQEMEAESKKAQAEADKFAMVQEAEGIRARGLAEAESIQAKAFAEAEGMEKKAQAYQKYNKAAVAEMMINVLPEIAGKIAEPLSQIDKITIIGGGSSDAGSGIGAVAGNVPIVMAKLFESVKESTGVDLSEIMRADSYDAKVTRNINLTGLSDKLDSNEKALAAEQISEMIEEQE